MPVRYSSIELIRLVENDGWMLISISGSHHKFKHPQKSGIVVIPHPKKGIPVGTSAQILKMAGLK